MTVPVPTIGQVGINFNLQNLEETCVEIFS